MEENRFVILGAGVIGLSLAYELSGRGARVLLVERGEPGRATSWAGAGILSPAGLGGERRPLDLLRAHSLRLLERWSRELKDATGIDNELHRCGSLRLAWTPEEAEGLDRAARDWAAQGIAVEEVPPGELPALEPGLAPGLARVYRLPGEAQVRNPRHLQALLAGCRQRGVEVRQGAEVSGLATDGDRIAGVEVDGERLPGSAFVVTSGAWSSSLLSRVGVDLTVRPVRGQIVLLRGPEPPFRHVLWEGSRYLVPRRDGRVLIGSTEEEAGFAAHPTAAGVAELIRFACRIVPSLAELPFERAWAGLRPGSHDGLPYLGPLRGWQNLYVASGHFRYGFELAAGTALILSEVLLGETPTLPLEPFRPDRSPS
jgi:glycine oxidase